MLVALLILSCKLRVVEGDTNRKVNHNPLDGDFTNFLEAAVAFFPWKKMFIKIVRQGGFVSEL